MCVFFLQVAIKKVLQDKRFKNRELQIIRIMEHPNVVMLKYNFFSVTERDERFLHLVLEFIPSTVYKCDTEPVSLPRTDFVLISYVSIAADCVLHASFECFIIVQSMQGPHKG